MANLTPKQRRVGRAFADRIALLAAEAPDSESKRDVYSAVNAIRKRYAWTDERKLAEVMRVICLGASTRRDIVNETQFSRQEVDDLVKKLTLTGRIKCEVLQLTGGGGRPSEHIFPTNDTFCTPKI